MLILSLRKLFTGMSLRGLTYDAVEEFVINQRKKRRLLREKKKLERLIREDRMDKIINDAGIIKQFGKKPYQMLENATLQDLARWERHNRHR